MINRNMISNVLPFVAIVFAYMMISICESSLSISPFVFAFSLFALLAPLSYGTNHVTKMLNSITKSAPVATFLTSLISSVIVACIATAFMVVEEIDFRDYQVMLLFNLSIVVIVNVFSFIYVVYGKKEEGENKIRHNDFYTQQRHMF